MTTWSRILVWLCLGGVLAFLYAPLLPPLLLAVRDPATGSTTLQNFGTIHSDPTLVGALTNSVLLAAIVGITAPLLGLAAAQAVRSFGTESRKRKIRVLRGGSLNVTR
jgi:ABC-type spermidine/putrescine transport system permease subunit II